MLVLLIACSEKAVIDSAAPVDLVASLAAPGPYNVGYHAEEIATVDPDGGGDRVLRLALWYPTEDSSGSDAEYLLPKTDPGAWTDAVPAGGPWPLVIFSHGHQGFAENSSFLMVHLASHGFAVAAPDHAGNTTFDSAARDTSIYYQRPLDLSAVLDYLELVPGDHPFVGRLADGPVLAIGHSFGGYTVFADGGARHDVAVIAASCDAGSTADVCSSWDEQSQEILADSFIDARIGAVVAMAPGDYDLFGAGGVAELAVPTMLMTGTLDGSTASDGVNYWSAITDGLWINIEGAGHQSFTDFSGILESGDDLIEADEGFRIIDVYALAMARRLGGDRSVDAVLDGGEIVSDVVERDSRPD